MKEVGLVKEGWMKEVGLVKEGWMKEVGLVKEGWMKEVGLVFTTKTIVIYVYNIISTKVIHVDEITVLISTIKCRPTRVV